MYRQLGIYDAERVQYIQSRCIYKTIARANACKRITEAIAAADDAAQEGNAL